MIYFILFVIFVNYLLVRNLLVFKFRMRISNFAYDFLRSQKYEEAIAIKMVKLVTKYSYGEMFLKFWKPLKSFYTKPELELFGMTK